MASPAIIPFLTFILLLLSICGSSRPKGTLQSFQTINSTIEADELSKTLQQAIEDFKSEVLRNLKMDKPPSGNLTNHFSNKMIELLQEEEKEISRSDSKENVIVRPSNIVFSCQRGNGTFCRQFDFNITSDLDSIITVHTYFHRITSNETLVLSVYDPDSFKEEPLIKLREDSIRNKTNQGWISFELPKKKAFKDYENHLICSIEIEGSEITIDGAESPFLVVTKHTEIIERKKREIEYVPSDGNCTCCAVVYHVTLADIGWETWVLVPQSFNIKVCRGQCKETLSQFTFSFTHVIRMFFKLNTSLPRPDCVLKPQCKAEKTTSLLMIYKTQNGELIQANMPNMIIDNCKCKFSDL